MAYYMRAFKSGNTVRLTLPKALRHSLELMAGDRVVITTTAPGRAEMVTYGADGRPKHKKGKTK